MWPSSYPYRREIRTLGPAEALNSRKLRFVALTVNLTVRATNPKFSASAGPKVLISFLYGYVEGHMTLNDFSWTGPLSGKVSITLSQPGKKYPTRKKLVVSRNFPVSTSFNHKRSIHIIILQRYGYVRLTFLHNSNFYSRSTEKNNGT